MTESPESVIRKFFETWTDPTAHDRIISFFDGNAVFIDGPRGVHRGADAIKSELQAWVAMGIGSLTIEVKSLVSDGATVMMERVDKFHLDDKPFFVEAMAAFEVNDDGRIVRWRDYYDLQTLMAQVEAAGALQADPA